jgi:hypothetical protein
MTRPFAVALLGWSLGFLAAGLWGLTQTGNHRLAAMLFVPAGVGIVVLGIVLIVGALRDRRWMSLDDVDRPEFIPGGHAPATSPATALAIATAEATAAAAAADAAAARIAELEARLALEQQQLDNVKHVLAETDSLAPVAVDGAVDPGEVDPAAVEMEPLLRQEVLETLVELVGTKADVVREFEAWTTGESTVPPVERPAEVDSPVASEQRQLQPVRRRRKRVKPKGTVDERAERVGKRDLRRGRARHTQQVGRADEDG